MREAGRRAELIVIDGASDPATARLLEHRISNAVTISEPDDGVYDAMNKGKAVASGRYIWFLNGGDEALVGWDELDPLLQSSSQVLLGGFELAGPDSSRVRRSRRPMSMWHALPTSHQAILYPAREVQELSYRTDYQVVADYAFTAELYAHGVEFMRESLVIARFHLEGLSTQKSHLIGPEANRVQRDILHIGFPLRAVSRLRHSLSRRYRQVLLRRAS